MQGANFNVKVFVSKASLKQIEDLRNNIFEANGISIIDAFQDMEGTDDTSFVWVKKELHDIFFVFRPALVGCDHDASKGSNSSWDLSFE